MRHDGEDAEHAEEGGARGDDGAEAEADAFPHSADFVADGLKLETARQPAHLCQIEQHVEIAGTDGIVVERAEMADDFFQRHVAGTPGVNQLGAGLDGVRHSPTTNAEFDDSNGLKSPPNREWEDHV